MSKRYLNYINGKWIDSKSNRVFESINPANKNDVLGIFPRSDKNDIDMAVKSAKKSFDKWSKYPAPKRADIMFKSAEIMVKRKEYLAKIMTMEMGKVLKESLGEIQEGIDMAYFIAGEGRRLYGDTTKSELHNKFAMSIRVPVGVVGLITPWNFPFAIPIWKIVPALICGNTAIFKPAEDTPLMANFLFEIFLEAGIPEGVLNIVHGLGEEAGSALVEHPDVDLISFTGSSDTGRDIAVKCASQYKRVSLEMGGKNAIIVMDDADVNLAIEGAIWGAFGTSGQRCTAASRLIVHEKVLDDFRTLLVDKTKTLKLGNGLLPSTDIGPIINETQLTMVHSYTEIGIKEKGDLILGGKIADEGELSDGFFYLPTIFDNVNKSMRIANEEIFGPITCIMPFRDLKDAIDIANSTRYGLSSSIYTNNINNAFISIDGIEAGITYVNSSTIGAEVHLPFGGVKNTGNGHREGGNSVIDIFTEWKTVYIDYSGRLQKAQIID